MKLSEYFEKTNGIGVLATTDASGQVNQAIYGRPHFLDKDDEEPAPYMCNRLSHDNVGHNPSASYLFIEDGEGSSASDFATLIEEETDLEKLEAIRRRNVPPISEEESKRKYLVRFHIEGVRPLIGTE